MQYAILCYSQQGVVDALTPAQDEAMMKMILGTGEELRAEGKLGISVRLMNTATAVSLRHGGGDALVLDGPFAETKEQLLGLYVVDCASLDDALDAARRLARGRTPGVLEIRPVRMFRDDRGALG
jgi:hypothetical protein